MLSGCQKMANPLPVVVTWTPVPIVWKLSIWSTSPPKSSRCSQPSACTPCAPARAGTIARTATAAANVPIVLLRIIPLPGS